MIRILFTVALVCFLGSVQGCRPLSGSDSNGSVTVELLEHDFIYIEDADAWLVFAEPLSDSRCPSDVECVTAGSASIRIQINRKSTQSSFVLEGFVGAIGAEPARGITDSAEGISVSLLNLDPYPVGGLAANDLYRARLRVDY